MPNYTVGPWTYEKQDDHFVIKSKPQGNVIGVIYKEADARLVANVTDLLNASQIAKNELCFGGNWKDAITHIDKVFSGSLIPSESPINPFYKEWTSTSIHSTEYEPDQQFLFITFKNGKSYRYSEVPRDEWDSLYKTESIGKYVNSQIKGIYPSASIDESYRGPGMIKFRRVNWKRL